MLTYGFLGMFVLAFLGIGFFSLLYLINFIRNPENKVTA
jgi:hypothetical protein